jgi:hypothetical protein
LVPRRHLQHLLNLNHPRHLRQLNKASPLLPHSLARLQTLATRLPNIPMQYRPLRILMMTRKVSNSQLQAVSQGCALDLLLP